MGVLLVIIVTLVSILYFSLKQQNENITQNKENNTHSNSTLDIFKSSVTKKIGEYSFLVSESEKRLAIRYDGVYRSENPIELDINNITKFEITQDDSVVSSGGVGRALVGGVLAGGIGAIVGASTAKQTKEINSIGIQFTTKDIYNPMVRVDLYGKEEKVMRTAYKETHSPQAIYRLLEELIAILGIVKEQ